MTTQVRTLLESFDMLSDAEQRECAAEILERSRKLDSPSLTDEQLVRIAEDAFLELDRCEANRA